MKNVVLFSFFSISISLSLFSMEPSRRSLEEGNRLSPQNPYVQDTTNTLTPSNFNSPLQPKLAVLNNTNQELPDSTRQLKKTVSFSADIITELKNNLPELSNKQKDMISDYFLELRAADNTKYKEIKELLGFVADNADGNELQKKKKKKSAKKERVKKLTTLLNLGFDALANLQEKQQKKIEDADKFEYFNQSLTHQNKRLEETNNEYIQQKKRDGWIITGCGVAIASLIIIDLIVILAIALSDK